MRYKRCRRTVVPPSTKVPPWRGPGLARNSSAPPASDTVASCATRTWSRAWRRLSHLDFKLGVFHRTASDGWGLRTGGFMCHIEINMTHSGYHDEETQHPGSPQRVGAARPIGIARRRSRGHALRPADCACPAASQQATDAVTHETARQHAAPDHGLTRAPSAWLSTAFRVYICSIDDLIALKQLASRPQDLQDIKKLRLIQEKRRRGEY